MLVAFLLAVVLGVVAPELVGLYAGAAVVSLIGAIALRIGPARRWAAVSAGAAVLSLIIRSALVMQGGWGVPATSGGGGVVAAATPTGSPTTPSDRSGIFDSPRPPAPDSPWRQSAAVAPAVSPAPANAPAPLVSAPPMASPVAAASASSPPVAPSRSDAQRLLAVVTNGHALLTLLCLILGLAAGCLLLYAVRARRSDVTAAPLP